MRKLIITTCVLTGILVACGKKMTPASTPTATEASTSKSVTEKTPEEKEKEAKMAADQNPSSMTALPATTAPVAAPSSANMEAGKSLYTGKCAKCHGPKPVGNYTFSQWEGILKKMVPNAHLSSDEEAQLTAYIKANAKQ